MQQSTLQSFWIDNRIFKCAIESETAVIDRDNQQMRQSGTKCFKVINSTVFAGIGTAHCNFGTVTTLVYTVVCSMLIFYSEQK